MTARLRLHYWLDHRGLSVYRLVHDSGGRLTRTWCYAVHRNGGRFHTVTADQLEALAEAFQCDTADLIESDDAPRRHR